MRNKRAGGRTPHLRTLLGVFGRIVQPLSLSGSLFRVATPPRPSSGRVLGGWKNVPEHPYVQPDPAPNPSRRGRSIAAPNDHASEHTTRWERGIWRNPLRQRRGNSQGIPVNLEAVIEEGTRGT